MKAAGLLISALEAVCAQEPPRFSSDVHLVMVDVQAVEKGTGRIVDLLGPQDFELYDNNHRQEICEFHYETTPLDVVFLIYGRSGAGPAKDINAFRHGLRAAAAALHSGDRAAILRTDSASKVDLAMTEDLAKAQHTIIWGGEGRYRTGYDHVYDAVMAASTLFPRPRDPARRRAIVAVTDDVERGSKTTLEALTIGLLEADATLNTAVVVLGVRGGRVGVGGVWGIPRVERNLSGTRTGASLRVAIDATGGEAIPGDEFQEKFPELIERIRMRYLLGFYAQPTTTREFHAIEVRLTPEARTKFPDALLRFRKGYYSEPGLASEGK
jgi:VWFA-related protein